MGLDVNIITGNLGQAIHTEDVLEYVREGLTSTGLKVGYSQAEYLTHGTNLLLECPSGNMYNQLFALRLRCSHSKLYMIVTELLTSSGFNSSNSTTTTHTPRDAHYDNRDYWDHRTKEFMRLVPIVDGLILVGLHLVRGMIPAGYEQGVAAYFSLGKPVHLVPLCPPPTSPRTTAPVWHSDKDIDILFTGTVTPYRRTVLDTLRSRNLKVVALDAHTPAYLRTNYVNRSKLSIGLKLSEQTKILSTARAYYHLIHRIPHVFERTAIQSPLNPFIYLSDSGEPFIEACAQLISGERTFPETGFSEFQRAHEFNYQRTFTELRSALVH
jgi:hypothetical protein